MPALTFGGIGSGIDVESIISGLVSASRGPLNRVNEQKSQAQSATSSVSDIGSLLSKLKTAAGALDTIGEVGSFKVTSSNEAIAATAAGNANAGSFELTVGKLATAYKTYSDGLGNSSSTALNQSGTLSLSTGGKSANLTIELSDTLDDVIRKINNSGLRVGASALFNGTSFQLQLRGLDTGAANDVTVSENGTTFNFAANVLTTGEDAELEVDGIAITSASNRVTGVIPGVTLALAKTIADPVTITVESDPKGVQDKLQSFVDAYNGVVNKIHSVAGFGSIKASNQALAGDSALRTITTQLGNAITNRVGTGKFQTLRSIGLELRNDGTLSLNASKLETALKEDPAAVAKVLAGDDSSQKGIMDNMSTIATDILGSKGAIQAKKDALDARSRSLTKQAELEQDRLNRLQEALRKQFNEMDQVVSKNQALGSFIR